MSPDPARSDWWTPAAADPVERLRQAARATPVPDPPTMVLPALGTQAGPPRGESATQPIPVLPPDAPATAEPDRDPQDGRPGVVHRADSATPRGPRVLMLRRVARVAGGAVLVFLLVVGFSLGRALGRPTSDSAAAKIAEWGRDHHLGGVVSFLEQKQLDLHPAKTGGTVAGGFHAGGQPATTAPPTGPPPTAQKQTVPHTAAPADLLPFGAAQPGEGQWQVLVRVAGLPALEYAGLTPDAVHTSYAASVAWMDPKLLRFEVRPGAASGDPGGTWANYPPTLAGAAQQKLLVAAFNGGFRLNGEAQGGFYLDGRTGRALVPGAASFVVYRNGTATVGQWGRDVAAGPTVLAVRQNLKLLIDHGVIAPTVDQGNSPVWGYTLGGTQTQWRSGVGVTRTGAIVYANGPAMTTRTLGEVLQRAGAVEAMELDINPEWTHLDWFGHDGAGVVANRLNPGQNASPSVYLSTEPGSRDFVAVFGRGRPTG